jgi:hypothetical protein
MTKGLELWRGVKAGFLAELDAMYRGPIEDRQEFWSTPRARTNWYLCRLEGALLPGVAQRLGMPPIAMQVMNFDDLFKDAAGFPQIFIEVENNAGLVAASELEKLCYVQAPLKLLITVSLQSRIPERRSKWIGDIAARAQWFAEAPEAVYGFISGDGQTSFPALAFSFFAASSSGEELLDERDEKMFENWFPNEETGGV